MSRRPPGRPARRGGLAWFLLCLLMGGLQAVSIAWPWASVGLWEAGKPSGGLQVLALAGLVVALQFSTRVGQGMWRAWVFATAWLAGTFWWLFVSMHTYGGMPAWLAVLAVLALAGLLALYYALAMGLLCAWAPPSRVRQALMFAALWTLAELARGHWFTGFPWGAIGYAHADTLAAWAPWVGVYGMGAVAALMAYALGSLVTASWRWMAAWLLSPVSRPPRLGGGTPSAARAGLHSGSLARDLGRASIWIVPLALSLWSMGPAEGWRAWGYRNLAPVGEMKVWLLQGNIPQDQKFEPGTGMTQALSWYPAQWQEAVQAARTGRGPHLVVAPETAVPVLPQQLGGDFWRGSLAALAADEAPPVGVLLGLPLGSATEGYTNSAWGLSPAVARELTQAADSRGASAYRYDKHHLVPFGEFVPPLFRWFTELMNIPLGDFNRGALPQPAWAWAGQRIAPNICYEDLFGEELAVQFRDPAQAPTVLVNLSNIAWFGDTVAIDQHLTISRLRAMELGRPMLRATNTGATAVIDAKGRVTAQWPRLTRGRLEADATGMTGATPYAHWAARWGLVPMWLGALAVAFGAMLNIRPRRSKRRFGR
ncbi:apolipoprotein N-acyltransferase [Hydrogenophaga sp.]|uniref:apolipoprotein N-acyltransferase n=1 Tax=Hydrogenophaga sp. TaxID=1904254 RepID=UPI0035B2F9B6